MEQGSEFGDLLRFFLELLPSFSGFPGPRSALSSASALCVLAHNIFCHRLPQQVIGGAVTPDRARFGAATALKPMVVLEHSAVVAYP